MSTIDGSHSSQTQGAPTRPPDVQRPSRRHVRRVVLRTCLVTVVMVCLYALAPLDRRPDGAAAAQLSMWLLVFGAVFGWQIRAVVRSSFPGLRAVEGIAVSLPLLFVVFASTYFVTGRASPESFSEPLTRVDAMYFTVTVFATVGFGDISPRTEAARLLVTTQMIVDLVLVGLIAKVLFGAVQHRRAALAGSHPQ